MLGHHEVNHLFGLSETCAMYNKQYHNNQFNTVNLLIAQNYDELVQQLQDDQIPESTHSSITSMKHMINLLYKNNLYPCSHNHIIYVHLHQPDLNSDVEP